MKYLMLISLMMGLSNAVFANTCTVFKYKGREEIICRDNIGLSQLEFMQSYITNVEAETIDDFKDELFKNNAILEFLGSMLSDKGHPYHQKAYEIEDLIIKDMTWGIDEIGFCTYYEIMMKHQYLFGIKFPALLNLVKKDQFTNYYKYKHAHIERNEEFNMVQLELEKFYLSVLTEKIDLKEGL